MSGEYKILNMPITLLIFFAIILVIVIVHEFGHFIFARLGGTKVEEFGFGFPPRLFGWQGKETLYSFNLIPLGGFVKIKGEDEEIPEPDSFTTKSIPSRALILAAGGIFNILLGFILLSFLAWYGLPALSLEEKAAEGSKVVIMNVLEDSPAEKLGLKPGDILISGESPNLKTEFSSFSQARDFIERTKGEEIKLIYLRKKERNEVTVAIEPGKDKHLGVAMANLSILKEKWYKSPFQGFKMTWETIKGTAFGIYSLVKNLIIREPVLDMVAGPVGIVSVINYSLGFGAVFVLHLVALISISIAVINLFPFPALDGGRIAFLLFEIVLRKPVSHRIASFVHAVGFSLLIILMLVITYFDIQRFF